MTSVRDSRAFRAALLTSAAAFGLAFSPAALAQDVAGPIDRPAIDEAQRVAQGDASPLLDGSESLREAYAPRGPDIIAAPTPQIVIGAPGTPTTAQDPNNVTGVGQMIVDQQNGFIGTCTGTLINPRTVIFAAHCVNDIPANAYGQNSGGQPIGFGFGRDNNAPGASAFGGWLNGIGGVRYATTVSRNMYDANYVAYNPLSTEPAAQSFLYGDVALASLDTPAENVPTWALMFSQLPDPGAIGAAGTGYHVVLDGYGRNGTGATGSIGSDYRRRLAENMLGALASIDDFEGFLFGQSGGLPQNLYWIDFDDPRRGTAAADPRDFNAWRDQPTPNEGITAAGDSGGPLILDRGFARQLVIGVLSGGYTQFFNGAPANGYGTASFYQPLYLYWDWIAANNPYHYVSAKAGNGNWNDAAHWVTNLDPNYYVLNASGQLVNGTPTTPGAQNTDQPGFGQACFQQGGVSDCYDVATGVETVRAGPIGSADNDKATVSTGTLSGTAANNAATASSATLEGGAGQGVTRVSPTAQAVAQALPAATLTNGLPGASNFVPTNFDGDRLTNTAPRYFDVTLSAAGTTTLNTAAVVDRFTMAGGGAALDITASGSLTSLMDIVQATGTMQVNGVLNTTSDYLMMSGGLNGTGTLNVPFFSNMAGTIAPGTAGTIGTLTFRGNVILASASTYLVDLSNSGASDLIRVQATTFNGTTPTNGQANIGGRLGLGFTNALRANQSWTILTAQGGVTGRFDAPGAISAILTPRLTYTANAVQLAIDAARYASVIDGGSAVQRGYASLLDQNRGNASAFDGIFGPLDLQSASVIRGTLEGLAPTTETSVRALGLAAVDTMSGMIRDRLQALDPITSGGTIAHIGQPLRVASLGLARSANLAPQPMFDGGQQMRVQEGALPEDVSAFFAGGYVDGDSEAMPVGLTGGRRDEFDGWYAAAGIEKMVDEQSAIGFAISYSDLSSDGAAAAHSVDGELVQGTLYGKYQPASGLTLDVQMSAGKFDTTTRRTVAFPGSTFRLTADDSALAFTSEVGLGYRLDLSSLFTLTPRIAGRATVIDFSDTVERGGAVALRYERQNLSSQQLRGSLTLAGRGDMTVKPFVTGTYVHDFAERPAVFVANFAGSQTPGALFGLAGIDREWAEVAGGITVQTAGVNLSIAGETTIWRDEVKNRSIRGSVGIKF
ncbi:autotransporter domain-containing protein [Sphingomonas sp. IC-56]|uniref:autotransporter domain-containing protein n=1 Tax=Sphingomonas sp. IC-56 TaxID=2898529 RepID=UPI001E4CD06A|nr:autotransporter domain-containing protein [Sphingomonas sp. IC-56]MCD2324194.1 autotransporter domain-containing protein [Sphingomonas sp. IC-56]